MIQAGFTSPGRLDRRGTDRGFTLLELVVVTLLVAVLAALAIPMYASFILKARETSVVTYLVKARKAQEMFRLGSPAELYSASFDELETTGMIEPGVGPATRVEEEYQVTLAAAVVAGEPVWSVVATPLSANPAAKHFYIDQTGIIRYAVGAAAGPASAPFGP